MVGISRCRMSHHHLLFTSSWRCKSATGQSQVKEKQHLTLFTVSRVYPECFAQWGWIFSLFIFLPCHHLHLSISFSSLCSCSPSFPPCLSLVIDRPSPCLMCVSFLVDWVSEYATGSVIISLQVCLYLGCEWRQGWTHPRKKYLKQSNTSGFALCPMKSHISEISWC